MLLSEFLYTFITNDAIPFIFVLPFLPSIFRKYNCVSNKISDLFLPQFTTWYTLHICNYLIYLLLIHTHIYLLSSALCFPKCTKLSLFFPFLPFLLIFFACTHPKITVTAHFSKKAHKTTIFKIEKSLKS